MVRPKKCLADVSPTDQQDDKPKKVQRIGAEEKEDVNLKYVQLVEIVRHSKSKQKSDEAFSTIIEMMKARIRQIAGRFNIPGFGPDDIYQEALSALRFKAIKDYDQKRSNNSDISPFDKFAVLCIRRHLSTKLKSSHQNKHRALNTSISIDQDRSSGGSSEESLFLADIIPQTADDVLHEIDYREEKRMLFTKLLKKLSGFEKEVLALYVQRYSYEEIAAVISRGQRKLSQDQMVKRVDNALSRIKTKGKSIGDRMRKKGESE